MAQHFAANPDDVRKYIIRVVGDTQPKLANAIQNKFGVSRATAHNYIRRFLESGLIVRTGLGKYALASRIHRFRHSIDGLEEHTVWAIEIAPALVGLPENVMDIWHYGCTEMINNVIDHSETDSLTIKVECDELSTEVSIMDDGVGIFRKIADALQLEDDRHAVLELSKGKLTTDPQNHTGEGIFFSSRVFDKFQILSGGVFFDHDIAENEDWIAGDENRAENVIGTSVFMTLENNSATMLRQVFDTYATDTEDYRFDKTVVPVKLLQYGDDRLISRSQAKRLMNRFDRFRAVVLNFQNVETIGQAFADEVFRVFQSRNPQIEIVAIHTNESVARMIKRVVQDNRAQTDMFGSES